MRERRYPVVVVGSGIIGLSHAILAREAGYRVVVFERSDRPLGASVRNFGTVWPIGCLPGPEREQALFGGETWKRIAERADIWHDPCGSLGLAYRDESWAVLREFKQLVDSVGFELLDRDSAKRRFPMVNTAGLRGGLFSRSELVVQPPRTMAKLVDYAISLGVEFHFGTPVVAVQGGCIRTSQGKEHGFDHLLVAGGDEMRLLFPTELGRADVQLCHLQMLRTAPIPEGRRIGAVLVSDLSLVHYAAFQGCPSLPALSARLDLELAECRKYGIHIFVAQHEDGRLTLGDSHEYGFEREPGSRQAIDDLILGGVRSLLAEPLPAIESRWVGTYLKSTKGITQVVLEPRERVTLVAAMGGLGMTLCWGLAKQTVDRWRGQD